jgi:hypothetical protein
MGYSINMKTVFLNIYSVTYIFHCACSQIQHYVTNLLCGVCKMGGGGGGNGGIS